MEKILHISNEIHYTIIRAEASCLGGGEVRGRLIRILGGKKVLGSVCEKWGLILKSKDRKGGG